LKNGAGRREKREKRRKEESEQVDEIEGEGGSSDEAEFSNSANSRAGRKCASCGRYKAKITQATQELNATKLECGTLQQKLDKVKNLIHIYRQEKRQMEEYIEKEKRTAKSMIAYLFIASYP
jgi:chaperonin GroEL (HSP60 family)